MSYSLHVDLLHQSRSERVLHFGELLLNLVFLVEMMVNFLRLPGVLNSLYSIGADDSRI